MRKPLFRGMKRWGGILLSALLFSSLLLAACDKSPSILQPSGPVADKEAGFFYFILIVATFVFLVVEGVLIYSIVRFRERPNSPRPAQIHGNNTVEVIWTVAPSLFLFIVLGVTIYSMFTLYPPTGSNTLNVRVVGHQWWWEFDYPNEHIVTADSLHVPQGVVVNAQLYSDNVIHSFWIPELTGKIDVVPGHDNHLVFRADKLNPDGYRGACAEYCGLQHAHMNFNVIVDTPDGFMSWVHAQQANAQSPTGSCPDPSKVSSNMPQGDLAACGQAIFKQLCVGCHGIVGVNLANYSDPKAGALIGPNLTHFGSRNLIAGGVLVNNPENLKKWLSDPQGVKPGNDMVVSITPEQADALVAYLESLK